MAGPDDDLPPIGGSGTARGAPEPLFFGLLNKAASVAATSTKTTGTPTLVDASATKSLQKNGLNALDTVARFRLSDRRIVTVKGNSDQTLKADLSSTQPSSTTGVVDMKTDLSKVTNNPWDIFNNNKKLSTYNNFKFFQPSGGALNSNPAWTDQPYYDFFEGSKSLGLFGASDGKEYTRSST